MRTKQAKDLQSEINSNAMLPKQIVRSGSLQTGARRQHVAHVTGARGSGGSASGNVQASANTRTRQRDQAILAVYSPPKRSARLLVRRTIE